MKPIISPSILSADFAYLAKDIEMINRSEADWVHIDIMDGVFVPNISFGFPVLKYVAKLTSKPLDVHLMIVNPEKFIPEVKALGAHIMNVHYEACPHLHRVVQQIREAGMQPAVTINPATPIDEVRLRSIISDLKVEKIIISYRARDTATFSRLSPPIRFNGPKFMLTRPSESGP